MEAGFIVLAIVMLVIGVAIGLFVGVIRNRSIKTKGFIYVCYSSENDNPSLLLEPDVPIDDFASQKQVSFDVLVIRQ